MDSIDGRGDNPQGGLLPPLSDHGSGDAQSLRSRRSDDSIGSSVGGSSIRIAHATPSLLNGSGAGSGAGGGGRQTPPFGFRRTSHSNASTRTLLSSRSFGSGTYPPTGTSSDDVYARDGFTASWGDDDKQRFFKCLSQTMSLQQQMYKHCEEIMKKMMGNASLVRLG